jgi:hypothetical protein
LRIGGKKTWLPRSRSRKAKTVPILILIFLGLWAWAELAVFIAIGSEVGALLTIIGIAVTARVGLWLLKSQGGRSWHRCSRKWRAVKRLWPQWPMVPPSPPALS